MSEPSVLAGLLPPDAVRLIEGQYADRSHLRPILDAVLAAGLALGPVTVEPRRTLVSLATPRRIFAVVQARTKNRVDLGLRLDVPDGPARGSRLLPARDLGAATVRIALPEPAELDDEALGWLPIATWPWPGAVSPLTARSGSSGGPSSGSSTSIPGSSRRPCGPGPLSRSGSASPTSSASRSARPRSPGRPSSR